MNCLTEMARKRALFLRARLGEWGGMLACDIVYSIIPYEHIAKSVSAVFAVKTIFDVAKPHPRGCHGFCYGHQGKIEYNNSGRKNPIRTHHIHRASRAR